MSELVIPNFKVNQTLDTVTVKVFITNCSKEEPEAIVSNNVLLFSIGKYYLRSVLILLFLKIRNVQLP